MYLKIFYIEYKSKIAAVRGGFKVTIVETKNGWHKIRYGNGYGYVSAQYVR
ncbi:SH3 domain-containing protein [Clostridium thermobutyricum]|uniref:SH3 domain-containing protein n=1 Tax=Clostridium thermobutyricum TaxID=29372 RepID=UPI002943E552|nr:SH3 domain-containing protein [Clostridium thermobutyricum]